MNYKLPRKLPPANEDTPSQMVDCPECKHVQILLKRERIVFGDFLIWRGLVGECKLCNNVYVAEIK